MICGAGFALMAWREAKRRNSITWGLAPQERATVERTKPKGWPASREYYRIIDNATHAVEHGPRCGGVTVTVRL